MTQPLAQRFGDMLADVLIAGLLGCIGSIPVVTAAAAWGASISALRSQRPGDPLNSTGGTFATWWLLFRQSLRTTKRLSIALATAAVLGIADVVFAATGYSLLHFPTLAVGVVLLMLLMTAGPHVVARATTSTQSMRRLLLDGLGLAAAVPIRSLLLALLTAMAGIGTALFLPIAPLTLGLLALLAAWTHDAALGAVATRQRAVHASPFSPTANSHMRNQP